MKQTASFIVRINRPYGVTVSELRAYIKEAVEAWSGGFNPDENPLFGNTDCTVKHLKETK